MPAESIVELISNGAQFDSDVALLLIRANGPGNVSMSINNILSQPNEFITVSVYIPNEL